MVLDEPVDARPVPGGAGGGRDEGLVDFDAGEEGGVAVGG